jgi:hypothetical protein
VEKIVTIISAEGIWAASVNAKAPPGQFGIEVEPVACLALIHDPGVEQRSSRVVGLIAGEDISPAEDAPNFLGYLHAGESLAMYRKKAAAYLAEEFGIAIDEAGEAHPVVEQPPEAAPVPEAKPPKRGKESPQ